MLKAPDAEKAEELGTGAKAVANLVMTDSQAQTMGWAMKMSTWFLVLRPTAKASNSKPSLETLHSILARGFPTKASAQIVGTFPESVDEP